MAKHPEWAPVELEQLMSERRVSRSDLARKLWGETIDARGRKVAKGRDRIGNYISGKAVPKPKTIARIAEALGVKPDELMTKPVIEPLPEDPSHHIARLENTNQLQRIELRLMEVLELLRAKL